MRVLLDEAITRRRLAVSEADSELKQKRSERERILKSRLECEYLGVLADGDDTMSLIAEKLLEMHEECEEGE